MLSDNSLATLRKLAESESNGYVWEQGLLFRHRLDELGLREETAVSSLEIQGQVSSFGT